MLWIGGLRKLPCLEIWKKDHCSQNKGHMDWERGRVRTPLEVSFHKQLWVVFVNFTDDAYLAFCSFFPFNPASEQWLFTFIKLAWSLKHVWSQIPWHFFSSGRAQWQGTSPRTPQHRGAISFQIKGNTDLAAMWKAHAGIVEHIRRALLAETKVPSSSKCCFWHHFVQASAEPIRKTCRQTVLSCCCLLAMSISRHTTSGPGNNIHRKQPRSKATTNSPTLSPTSS